MAEQVGGGDGPLMTWTYGRDPQQSSIISVLSPASCSGDWVSDCCHFGVVVSPLVG